MTTKQVEVRDLKEGNYIMIEDEVHEIRSYTTSQPGKHGSAKARIEGEKVFTGGNSTITQPVDASVRVPIVDRKEGQVVNVEGNEAQVMDLETYQTTTFVIPNNMELEKDQEIVFLEHEDKRKIVET